MTPEEWAALTPEQRGPCDEWPGYRDARGYGWSYLHGKRMSTHRIAWISARRESERA